MDRPGRQTFENDDLGNLLQRIAAGDEASLNTLYELTSPRVYGIALKILGDEPTAEDILVEVFAKIWRQAQQFDPLLGNAQVWINALVRNCSLDHMRRKQRHLKVLDSVADQPKAHAHTHAPDFPFFEQETAVLLRTALGKLDQEQRQALLAAYFGGMSHRQIAATLNQPLGTVKTRIRKGLENLRKDILKRPGDSS